MNQQSSSPIKGEWQPARVIALSFAGLIAVGTLLLMLPLSSAAGTYTNLEDALFTATSASCVTGLVTVDTGTHWSVAGQVVILLLIQLGGLGLVTIFTFFTLMLKKRMGLRSMQLARESINSFDFENLTPLLRQVIGVSLGAEFVGALLLSFSLVPRYGAKGLFYAVFLSVSAFCNAGFDPLGVDSPFCSLTNFSGSAAVLLPIMMLVIIGGLGFSVWSDVINFRRSKRLSLHSRVVLLTSAGLIAVGAVVVLVLEWQNPATIGGMSVGDKLLNSLFASVSSRTAGFNSIDIGAMNGASKLFMTMLMFIGASPGSTGGGIKVTAFIVLVMTVWCVLKGEEETIILKRQVRREMVYKALAIMVLGMLACTVSTVLIMESFATAGVPLSGVDATFEAVSAFATVGLSVGVTGEASHWARLALIASMYLGRVGPVSFGLALSARVIRSHGLVLPEGKIIVG